MSEYLDIMEIARLGEVGTKLAEDLVPGDVILVPHPWNTARRQRFSLEEVVAPGWSGQQLALLATEHGNDSVTFDARPLAGRRMVGNWLTSRSNAYRTVRLAS